MNPGVVGPRSWCPVFRRLAVLLGCALGPLSLAQSGGGLELTWHALSCGAAGASAGAGFELRAAVGQPAAGTRCDGFGLALAEGYGAVYAIHSYTLRLNLGWNLVSIPIQPLFPGLAEVLPATAPGPVWAFAEGRYLPEFEVMPMEGYWVWTPVSGERTFQGVMVEDATRAVAAGWHLVGPSGLPPYPSLALPLETIPAAAVPEPPWEWDWGLRDYSRCATSLDAGSAYWIRTAEAAILRLGPY